MVTRVQTIDAAPPPGQAEAMARLEGVPPQGSLEALAVQADNLGDGLGEFGPAVQPVAPPLGLTNAKLLKPMFVSVRETVCAISGLESPRVTFTDAKAQDLADIWGECAAHYELDLAKLGGKWGALGAAAFATFGVLSETVVAARVEIAANGDKKPDKPAQVAMGAERPGPAPVAPPGAVVTTFTPGEIRPSFGA